MQTTIILWVISVLSIASSTVVYMTNETHDLIQFAHDIAVINKIDPAKFVKLINCESKFKSKAAGDWSSEEEIHKSFGPLQFWEGTFLTYRVKYDMPYLEYTDPKDQLILGAKMLGSDPRNINHWFNCSRYIKW